MVCRDRGDEQTWGTSTCEPVAMMVSSISRAWLAPSYVDSWRGLQGRRSPCWTVPVRRQAPSKTERRPRFVHPRDRWQPGTAMSTSGAAQAPNASQASPQELNRLRLRAVEVRSVLMAGLRTISALEAAKSGTPAHARFFGVVEGYGEALCKALRQPVAEHQSQEYERLRIRTRQIISQHSRAAYARGTPISDGTRTQISGDQPRFVIDSWRDNVPAGG